MLDSLKQAKKNLTRGFSRTLDHVAEGWRELVHRGSDALTHFNQSKHQVTKAAEQHPIFPRWSLLAGEIEETDKEIVARVEAPGMEKEDFQVMIDGSVLYIKGEKHFERATEDSTYHVMERAYGLFQRTIPLPREVDDEKAEANYKNGVLTVRLPKLDSERGRIIPLSGK